MASQPAKLFTAAASAFNGLNLTHGFFGRQGGISTGPFESLNASYTIGDDQHDVDVNRARIADAMGLAQGNLVPLRQTHTDICVTVKDVWGFENRPEADAMVTDKPGIGLGILTADCAPVLFAAPGIVGAAHAGWGGALKGVLESTIGAMEKLGAQRSAIRAAIGPCIAQKSYEVSLGFETPFLAEDAQAERFFKAGSKPDKLMFDLPGYCAYRLGRAGIEQVEMIDRDTLSRETEYFSHRRTTQRGETKRGLQLSVITLRGA